VVEQSVQLFFLVIFLIGVALVFLASEIGWRLGVRTKGHGASGNISALEQSLLGFLALIIGFIFNPRSAMAAGESSFGQG
jgi:uncharacterized protein YqgC (DUF456 family)